MSQRCSVRNLEMPSAIRESRTKINAPEVTVLSDESASTALKKNRRDRQQDASKERKHNAQKQEHEYRSAALKRHNGTQQCLGRRFLIDLPWRFIEA